QSALAIPSSRPLSLVIIPSAAGRSFQDRQCWSILIISFPCTCLTVQRVRFSSGFWERSVGLFCRRPEKPCTNPGNRSQPSACSQSEVREKRAGGKEQVIVTDLGRTEISQSFSGTPWFGNFHDLGLAFQQCHSFYLVGLREHVKGLHPHDRVSYPAQAVEVPGQGNGVTGYIDYLRD